MVMPSTNIRALVGKLNRHCHRALDGAAGLCMSRTNYDIEIEHWLLKLLELDDADLTPIIRHYGVNPGRVNGELTRAIDKFKTGNGRVPPFAPKTVELMRKAWTVSSLDYGAGSIRSGYLLTALLADEVLADQLRRSSPELAKIAGDKLHEEVQALIEGSSEDEAPAGMIAADQEPGSKPGLSKTPALDQFTMNLTQRAKKGEIDPVIGRDSEIRQVIDILQRRRQNNPILTGEAGVGKTAVVEGFALRIVADDVPPPLRGVAVRTLDLGLLQAGAGVKGEFENRLKSVIAEVKASAQPIILFIDEAHTVVGAGAAAGQGDAANLLKPALARGELRTIAATTWAEYKKYFETDAALKRRFQVVKVDEPDEEGAIRMMRGLTAKLEEHHKVRILHDAVTDSVKLSHRYISDRQLPDKSVSLLDTACARVGLSQFALPPVVEDCRRELEHLDREMKSLERERAMGGGQHAKRLAELTEETEVARDRLAGLESRWKQEQELVEKIQELRARLEEQQTTGKAEDGHPAKTAAGEDGREREDLARLQQDLARIQGDSPLVHPFVDSQAIASVVSAWTGIPVGRMVLDEIKTVLALRSKLEERIVGQNHALETIARRVQTSRANLVDPRRPVGVFLLVGPSGIGKTETALALSDILYGGDRNMVVINMSEFKDKINITRLIGSAPGYVGFGEGGVLTEAVRRKPYSIVLLDEVEKADKSVQEIFYQVFDKGTLKDDKGNEVDFKNTIIFLTTNVGSDKVMKICADPDTRPEVEGLASAIRPELLNEFRPALLGRLTIVPYFPLSDDVLRQITHLQLHRIGDRIRANHRATFQYDDALVNLITGRCKEVETGARNIDHIITGTMLPEIAREFLTRMAEGKAIEHIRVSVDSGNKFVYEIN
jgi:type VI secretion system protein VasG